MPRQSSWDKKVLCCGVRKKQWISKINGKQTSRIRPKTALWFDSEQVTVSLINLSRFKNTVRLTVSRYHRKYVQCIPEIAKTPWFEIAADLLLVHYTANLAYILYTGIFVTPAIKNFLAIHIKRPLHCQHFITSDKNLNWKAFAAKFHMNAKNPSEPCRDFT